MYTLKTPGSRQLASHYRNQNPSGPDEAALGVRWKAPPGTSDHAEGSNVDQLAGQLTQRWTHSVWRQIEKLLAKGPDSSAALPPSSRTSRQIQVRLTPNQVAELVREYQTGASIAAVARTFHINHETAARHLKTAGIQTRQPGPAIPPDEVAYAVELRAQGLSYGQIAKIYGCSDTSVRNVLLRVAAIPRGAK